MMTKQRSAEKIARNRLESLPGWAWSLVDAQWNDGMSHREAYLDQNGHAKPPATYETKEGYRLGKWLENQNWKNKPTSQDRVAKLESLAGWVWCAG